MVLKTEDQMFIYQPLCLSESPTQGEDLHLQELDLLQQQIRYHQHMQSLDCVSFAVQFGLVWHTTSHFANHSVGAFGGLGDLGDWGLRTCNQTAFFVFNQCRGHQHHQKLNHASTMMLDSNWLCACLNMVT